MTERDTHSTWASGEGRPAAFFDLDKTIIAKSSTLAFGRPLYKAGFLNRRALLKAGIAQIVYVMVGADHDQMEKVRGQLLALTKGWDRHQVGELVRETVDEIVAPLVYAEALAIIDEHHRAGRKVVIISSSPEEVVRPLAVYLGVDDVIATRSKSGPDGRYTGELEFYAYGPGKAEAIREMAERESLNLEDSYAYSDSITDLPMLEAVGHPVVVNPDKELEEIATARDWQVMDFERPVTLRTRLATLPKPVPIISGAALAGALGSAAIWWAIRTRGRSS
ncbi:MAG: HAD-IB family hydrolase [Acidimicrobiia bacterium]|nr:HAD-IB family hydrolase [Acidimicrobiia bacterium]